MYLERELWLSKVELVEGLLRSGGIEQALCERLLLCL